MSARTQDDFVRQRDDAWTELDGILNVDKPLHRMRPELISRTGELYRSICADLMRARSSGYSRDLVAYLDALTARAHNALYGARPFRFEAVWELVARGFPQTLRRNQVFLWIATALFVLPLLFGTLMTLATPDFATHILPKSALEGMVGAYSEGIQGRSEAQDTMMTGFYVYNNVGIAFRCFATGIFFGLGSVFFLFYNGLVIGTTLGAVTAAGYGQNIFTFVCGHGSFELTAIVISGGAGLQMGYALVDTKGQTRLGSLRAQAGDIAQLIVGAALMLGIAALIEGFWSPSAIAPPIKWGVAGGLWLGVIGYLALAGRWDRRADPKRGPRRLATSGPHPATSVAGGSMADQSLVAGSMAHMSLSQMSRTDLERPGKDGR